MLKRATFKLSLLLTVTGAVFAALAASVFIGEHDWGPWLRFGGLSLFAAGVLVLIVAGVRRFVSQGMEPRSSR